MVAANALMAILSLFAFFALVIALAEWIVNRKNGTEIICWNCLEEYPAAATNCPICGVVKDKPYRCPCGRLHAAGTKCPNKAGSL